MKRIILLIFLFVFLFSTVTTVDAINSVTSLRLYPDPIARPWGMGMIVYEGDPVMIGLSLKEPEYGGYAHFYEDGGRDLGTVPINGYYAGITTTFPAGWEGNWIYGVCFDKNGRYIDNGRTLDGFYIYPKPSTNVPEFPNIAAPVAAILCLVMIFGRRKNTV